MTRKIIQLSKNIALCLFALVILLLAIIYTLLSLPVYIYRFIVCRVVAPVIFKGTGKAVTLQGSSFAYELEGDSSQAHPRSAVVATLTFDGLLNFQFLKSVIQNKWIAGRNSPGSGLAYPEFQQHIESWMGFLFWKQDQNFNLDDHLFQEECKATWTEQECETYICATVEDLLNKPFPKEKSPWEIHLITGYRNSSISSAGSGSDMSLFIMRYHHCLADGFAYFSAMMEGAFGIPLSQCYVAKPSNVRSRSRTRKKLLERLKYNFILSFVNYTSFPFRMLLDIGNGILTKLKSVQIAWHDKSQKCCRQLYARSDIIPIGRIKRVKNSLDVQFTAVLMSSVGAGLAKYFASRNFSTDIRTLPIGIPLPLNNHPKKLRNHVTGAILDISVDQSLNPLQRLRKSETLFQNAKHSTYPLLSQVALKLFASQVIPIARRFSTNGMVPAFLTNFPGPGVQLNALNSTLLTVDFAVGLLSDVSGVGFMVISYFDHIRIAATASSATMSKQELMKMIDDVVSEINKLNELIPDVKSVEILEIEVELRKA